MKCEFQKLPWDVHKTAQCTTTAIRIKLVINMKQETFKISLKFLDVFAHIRTCKRS